MTQKSELGKKGEDFACEYLVEKGYKIVDRNVRKPWGEIDIIAYDRDGTLVFIEVKTMTIPIARKQDGDALKPEDQMTRVKLQKSKKAAQLYAGHYAEKIREDRGWRVDVVALTLSPAEGLTLTEGQNRFVVNHYENIT